MMEVLEEVTESKRFSHFIFLTCCGTDTFIA